jgi:hypothetical protein
VRGWRQDLNFEAFLRKLPLDTPSSIPTALQPLQEAEVVVRHHLHAPARLGTPSTLSLHFEVYSRSTQQHRYFGTYTDMPRGCEYKGKRYQESNSYGETDSLPTVPPSAHVHMSNAVQHNQRVSWQQ